MKNSTILTVLGSIAIGLQGVQTAAVPVINGVHDLHRGTSLVVALELSLVKIGTV